MEFGMWVTIIAFGLFYLRLALLRSQKKREIREQALAVKRQGKGAKMTVDEEHLPGYKVTSWVIIVVAVVLMLAGMMARQSASFPAWAQEYWYVGTALGAILFAFGFK
ncbi:MAG TPA: hypothetical protein VIH16_04715 [Bellilinea sp.]